MNTKTDEGLYEKARKLFISKASIDEFAGWATPRQVDAVHRLLDTELANDMGLGVRFHQTAELVLQLGKAKRDGTLETMLRDIGRADLIILDEFGYVPFDIDGARLLYQIIAGSYERRSIIFTTNIEFSKWGTVFADDKLAAAIIDRIVHHGRLLEFTGQSRRVSEALMFGRNTSAQPEK